MVYVYKRQHQRLFWRSTTIHTNVSEIETDASLPDWSTVEVKAYLNERVETVVIMHTTLCCPKIINASFDLFPTWKKYFIPKEKCYCSWIKSLVRWTYYRRPMKLTAFFNLLFQFEIFSLPLPLHVLEDFSMENVIAEYKGMVLLIENILYMERIVYQFSSRNVITKMCKH